MVMVEGVDKPSCALACAAEGNEGGEVHIEEDLGGQLGGEHVERAEGVCGEKDESRRVLGAVEWTALVEVGESGIEVFNVSCIR